MRDEETRGHAGANRCLLGKINTPGLYGGHIGQIDAYPGDSSFGYVYEVVLYQKNLAIVDH
jgi:hypothetical protein